MTLGLLQESKKSEFLIDPKKIAQDIYGEMQPETTSLIDPKQVASELHQDLQKESIPIQETPEFQFGGGESRGAGAVSQEDFEAPESKAKDIADAFYLNARDMWHRSKQYFTSALPNLVFRDVDTSKRMKVSGHEFVMDGMWIGTKEQATRKNQGNRLVRKEFKRFYDKQEDKYKEWIKANPELQPRKGWDKGVIETVKKNPKILLDPAYWGFVAAKSAAFTMGVMGTTVGVTAITKNPYAGLMSGVAVATPMQSQDLYEDLIDNGATEEQAAKLAVPIGTLIASVEVAGDLPLLRAVSAPIKKMLTRQTGKQVAKLTMRQIAKKGLKTFGAVQIAETLEEVAQTAIQNATVKTINENRSILEGIPETIVQTMIATTPFALVGGGAEVRTQLAERIKGTSLEDIKIPKPPRIIPSLGIEEVKPIKPISKKLEPLAREVMAKDINEKIINDILPKEIKKEYKKYINKKYIEEGISTKNLTAENKKLIDSTLEEAFNKYELPDIKKRIWSEATERLTKEQITKPVKITPTKKPAEVVRKIEKIAIPKKEIRELEKGIELLIKEEKRESRKVVEDILKGAEEFRKGATLIAREQEREFRIKRQKLLQTERTKYQEKMADIKERMQKQGLKEALRKEAMGARRAYVVGKREGIQKLREHYKEVQERGRERIKAGREIRVMVAQIKRLNVQALPVEYQDQINTIRDSLYLKRMTEKKALKIENMREFVERQKELGEPILIPEKQLDLLDKTPLNKMTIEEFKDAHSALMRLAYQGKLKGKLIAGKEQRDLYRTASELSQSVANIAKARKRFKAKIEIEERVKTPSERRRKGFERIKDAMDSTLSNLRKWDSITEEADGFRYFGKANRELFGKINQADIHELKIQKRIYTQLENLTKYIKKDSKEITKKQYDVEGTKITKEEAMAVYANSLNPNNRIRLTEGYGFSDEKIDKIIDLLSPEKNKGKNLKKLTDRYMQLINSLWPETSEVLRKLTGDRMGKVENYWPIKSDFELSKRAKLRMAEKDLFQDIMEQVYIQRRFTKERIGGKEPVDLQFFRVLTNHIDGVIHFNSFAIPVRDVQKLLHHPLVESALKTSIGEHKYKQGVDWLKDVANPRRTPLDKTEKIAKYLRTRAVMAMLGIKVSVSLKQAGSIFQTINRIGIKDTLNGLRLFYKNPRQAVRSIFEMSPSMENRRKSFDRELKDMLDEQESKLFGKDKQMKEVYFWLIRAVDQLTTYPSWLGAFNKQMNLSKNNVDKSIEYADTIARRTQPTARIKDLANIQRGSEFRKIFVPFYTHFSNVYNELSRTTKRFKYGDIGIPEAVMSYAYLLIMPAVYSMIASRLAFTVKDELEDVDWRATMARMAKEIATYGAASVPIVGSLVNSVLSGFEFRPIPALEGIREIAKFGQSIKKGILKTAEYEDIEGLLEELPGITKHGIKGAGYLLGKPTPQIMTSYEGIMDLMHGETEDWRRLILSKYALREK